MIDAKDIQEFLAKTLFGDQWESYKDLVVHRQGNLPNAQQRFGYSAFFTYYVSSYEKKTLNISDNGEHTANVVMTLNLQGIGTDVESMMLNTLFWDERSDVRDNLSKLNCILLETPRMIVSSPYFQDGANTILSYETVFKISCALLLKEQLEPMPEIVLLGGLRVPPYSKGE